MHAIVLLCLDIDSTSLEREQQVASLNMDSRHVHVK